MLEDEEMIDNLEKMEAGTTSNIKALLPVSQGQHLALTVLYGSCL